ncbi:unnamed protein product [Fusarium graminearum]|uniref:Uncharacterized protein n=1 Tax=Gibberella zeae TaxID=5518 RepID=A0A4E9EIT7_GIBZA|nr:unnamed protein product [Fusarium graminearum]CAG1998724.1 unnamed protein product [Fusarium graminearum]CAG2011235.1 unnamed protein product [Fusarium graminearum]
MPYQILHPTISRYSPQTAVVYPAAIPIEFLFTSPVLPSVAISRAQNHSL